MKFETVIGLEVHVELSTKTKIFCGCSTEFGGEPNAHTCPVCLGMPGTLPVLNREAVEKALCAGIALHCEIPQNNLFDRKNYFYPDLPKDYQISQLYHPICQNGVLEIEVNGQKKPIRIHEIHMEEDAGKLIHDSGASLVDFNRCGVPLIEIVSEPDMRSADDVVAYLEKLRETLVYLGVSDCKMEEGSMRADVNLSLRPIGTEEFGTRTETKNMNSIKAIQRVIHHETGRQTALLEAGGIVVQETRRWDDTAGESSSMRSKENAQDYRYFPEPDLVPLDINSAWVQRVKENLPELAEEKRTRYVMDWNLSPQIAAVLTVEKETAELFEDITNRIGGTEEDAREAANIVTGEVLRLLKGAESGFAKTVSGEKIGAVIEMIRKGKINRNTGKDVIENIVKNDGDPETYVKEHGLGMTTDDALLEETVIKVLSENSGSVQDYQNGKEKAFGFLVGQTMRALSGKADPQAVNTMLKTKLEESGVVILPTPENAKKKVPEEIKPEKEIKTKTIMKENMAKDKESNVQILEIDEKSRIVQSERYRTHTCGDLRETQIGTSVKLAGWVQSIRDHGGVVFVDLRDQYGITQVVVRDEQAKQLHKEMSVSITGRVLKRDEETINSLILTGTVELEAEEIEILGFCRNTLPFEIEQSKMTKEELRLKYRYLDLRNPKVHERIAFRAEIIKYLRARMDSLGFMEVQTPILANSSPEGARDYLVPSRKHKGRFYALPQAPQQFKQLLMVSGFDRYYQIAPCFRDEDARLDRSPGEFYQLDFEMAYATQEDVFAVAEYVMTKTFEQFTEKPVTKPPYPRITYAESMMKYGSDKPDLRNPLRIIDLESYFKNVEFKPFQGRPVRAIRVPNAGTQPRSFFREMEKFALNIGMKGLGYVTVQEDFSYKGPIEKFLSVEQKKELLDICEKESCPLQPTDVLYFISDTPDTVAKYAGQIRTEVAERLGLIDKTRFEFCFIIDYPMYELNEESGQIDFTHNPFSMPQGEMEALQSKNPLDILAYQYDIVCNGVELSSGAVRNHRPDIMVKAFEIAGYTEEDVEKKFGALYNAFSYGAPPHAGMAPGVDRIIMLLSEEENIREIIAFPLNSNAQNLMLDAPSEVTEQQLREVHIKIR